MLVNRLGGLCLPRKSVVRLTDRPDMTLDVFLGRKTTMQPTFQCLTYFGDPKNYTDILQKQCFKQFLFVEVSRVLVNSLV